jgi:hypothetical protein
MYDETIQRALRRLKIEPLVLPAQFLDAIVANFRSDSPQTEILTGTAGDGKTYHCREVWMALGGSATDWNRGEKVQTLTVNSREFVIIKDLSELRVEESAAILERMAADVTEADPSRVYLIAANHGQLLEKLKAAPQSEPLRSMTRAIEGLLVTGINPDPSVRLNLGDLSQAPASEMIGLIIDKMMSHPGWGGVRRLSDARRRERLSNRGKPQEVAGCLARCRLPEAVDGTCRVERAERRPLSRPSTAGARHEHPAGPS